MGEEDKDMENNPKKWKTLGPLRRLGGFNDQDVVIPNPSLKVKRWTASGGYINDRKYTVDR